MTTTTTTATTGKPVTPAQQDVLDVITKHFVETGTGPSQREIMAKLGFTSVNGIKEKIAALIAKGFLVSIEIPGQTDDQGYQRYKANTIRPSNWQELMGGAAKPTVGEFASYSTNFAFVIMGDKVAFMFFNDEKRASDVMLLADALQIATNFKIVEGTDSERLAKLAEKTAAKRLK
jgi:SOS-response transcriptional repressor LexA